MNFNQLNNKKNKYELMKPDKTKRKADGTNIDILIIGGIVRSGRIGLRGGWLWGVGGLGCRRQDRRLMTTIGGAFAIGLGLLRRRW